MNVYIDNLSHADISRELRAAFEAHGMVRAVTIITDELNGKKRGFGIIEMPNEEEAKSAIIALEGIRVAGHDLHLSDRRANPSRRGYRDRRIFKGRKNAINRRKTLDRRGKSN